jgi:hypothetical protein
MPRGRDWSRRMRTYRRVAVCSPHTLSRYLHKTEPRAHRWAGQAAAAAARAVAQEAMAMADNLQVPRRVAA